ncbi:MAG TPA: PrsW family intramembrane metalloprotease [Pyrinomonadaceae bacterium]|nr:PrsW family intramembrane metalloprotease [Pyrinomonadaceae bacterium]
MLKIAAGALAALVALLLGLATLLLIGYDTGPVALLVGLVAAVLPVPFYVTLVLWLDRYESEPAWLLAVAFFWGALVAVFFAIVVNSLGAAFVGAAYGEEAANFFGLVVSAPLVEEGTKAFALLALFFWRRDEFDGVLDGIVYAAMVGLGFAMTENVQYYGAAALEGNTLGVFVVRGLFSPFAHPLFTAMTGIGLGLVARSRRVGARALLPPLGFALAVLLHAAWNAAAYFTGRLENGLIVLGTYFLLMVPVFCGLLAVVAFALRHEGSILREHLRADCEGGLLSAEEYARVCSLRGRMGATFGALARRGVAASRARARLNRAASELAFHRHRVARGVTRGAEADAAREAEYVQRIRQLRAQLER